MHDTAQANADLFFRTYVRAPCTILEIGSMDVNGSLRASAPRGAAYVGLDLHAGPGVDVVVASGASFPLRDGTVDIALSSSAFEHDRLFWRTFVEMCRVTRPGGYIYINVPSNGPFHAYPVDCWRFYPDAGVALEQLAAGDRWPVRLIESFVADRRAHNWNDFVAVFRRDGTGDPLPSERMHRGIACRNVFDVSAGERLHVDVWPQDAQLLVDSNAALDAQRLSLEKLAHDIAMRDQRIGELSAIVARLERRNDALAAEADAFNASWCGRLHRLLRRRPVA
jgi:SAM-dependent methyltransferase